MHIEKETFTLTSMSNNKGLTAFVVDDTPMALETLANDLRRQPEFEKVYT